jgi:hypothetical protein
MWIRSSPQSTHEHMIPEIRSSRGTWPILHIEHSFLFSAIPGPELLRLSNPQPPSGDEDRPGPQIGLRNHPHTMGISSSRPGKPKVRALQLTKQRNSVALRQRISLNRATLQRTLQQMGYSVRGQSRLSMRSRHRASRTSPPATRRRQLGQTRPGHHSRTRRRSQVATRSSRQVDRNKPLPPLPQPSLSSSLRLEEELERAYIERHREATLRQLESGRESPPTLRSQVPSIILRRAMRSRMLGDYPVTGTANR